MAKTKTEVKKHAAEILGIKTVGQDITQPWVVKLEELWDAAYDEIKHENLNIFSSAGPLPDKLYHSFAMLMADKAKTSMSVPETRYNRITLEARQAMRDFRKYASDRYESINDPTDF